MPPPDWLGNLIGTILATILIAAWNRRPRAVVAVFVALAVVGYAYALAIGSLRIVLPSFLIITWKPLLVGVAVGVAITSVVWRRSRHRLPADASVPSLAPSSAVTTKEWLEQEGRFKRLSGRSSGLWTRFQRSGEVKWNVTPMDGSSADDLREFRAEATLAGQLLNRAGLVSAPRGVTEDDWLDAVKALADDVTGLVISGTDENGPHEGRSLEHLERRSALACTLLAGGARPESLPSATPSLPAPQSEATRWNGLTANEREVLNRLWGQRGRFLFFNQFDWPTRFGEPEWNAVLHTLTASGLVGISTRLLPGATSYRMKGKTLEMTDKGAALMTWATRQKPPAE